MMNNSKMYFLFLGVAVVIIGIFLLVRDNSVHNLNGTVVDTKDEYFVVKSDNSKYKFAYLDSENLKKDYSIKIKYKGRISTSLVNKMESYTLTSDVVSVVDTLEKNGIFRDYYAMAQEKLDTMTIEEKIGQLLLVRVPTSGAKEMVQKYQFGGYVLFERDFKDKSKEEINNEINSYQEVSKIPMIMSTDEEGGKVVRASSNAKLIDKEFLSSQELYKKGGFDLIKEDTVLKSKFLNSLGINVNLAPVVDVVTDPTAYMFERSFGQNTKLTSEYAKTVIDSSKTEDVSYVLKHFPGYGNNSDTHVGGSVDDRSYDEIVENDLPPFKAGIDAKAEAVLVSHNLVKAIDTNNIATLSKKTHELLRNDLDFSGVIITDDMDMLATKGTGINNVYLEAIKALNDMIIVTDYEAAFNEIKDGIDNKDLDPEIVDKAVLRILAWKYYKILFPNKG